MNSRRGFLKSGSLIAAGMGFSSFVPFDLLETARSKVPPSDRIRLAAIGLNGMGWTDLNSLLKNPEVEVVTLCDVDENVLNRRKGELNNAGIKVKTEINYLRVLEDADIDAVLIATPDHWHCKIMIDACSASKDVYCEKPLGRTIGECDLMVRAQHHYGSVVQVGQWQRSMQHFADAVDFVQSGRLGKIRLVKSWAYQGWMKPIPVKPDGIPPSGVHYDLWLGPSPKRPFNPNRFHFNFRWFYDYAGGLMTDWGVHLIDYALLGMNAGMPEFSSAMGGKDGYPHDAEEWPDTMGTLYRFPGYQVLWEQAVGINEGPYNRDHGIAYIGNNGTLILNREGWEVIPEKDSGQPKMEAIPFRKASDNGIDKHTSNFLEVIRSRDLEKLHTPVLAAALVAKTCHMGNIANLTGQTVQWLVQEGKFADIRSNRYIEPLYHNGFQLPRV